MVGLTRQDAVFTKGYLLDDHEEKYDDQEYGHVMIEIRMMM